MSEEIEYLDLYADRLHNPTAVKKSTGLSGFWAVLPQDHSVKTWGINESIGEFQESQPGLHASTLHIGIERSIRFIRFLVDQGLPLHSATTVADIGCGDGKMSILMSRAGLTVHAIEPSRKQLKILKNNLRHPDCDQKAAKFLNQIDSTISPGVPGPLYIHQSLAENLPLPDRSVDAVTMKFSLQWTNDLKTLAEIKRILKPGGSLFIMTTTHQPDQPDLFCRAWNTLVDDLEKEDVTFKNLASPKNPIPMHHLPTLTRYLFQRGFSLKQLHSSSEETGKNPAIFVAILMRIFGDQLRYCLEGNHGLDDKKRNRMIVRHMNELGSQNGQPAKTEENIVMLHYQLDLPNPSAISSSTPLPDEVCSDHQTRR